LGKTLFQHSTIGALMAGMFEGTYEIDELLKQGNVGIGTLHGLDGELVVIDGISYQVTIDGAVKEVDRKAKTPYAAVVDFEKKDSVDIRETHSNEQLQEKLREHFASKNTFQAVKITGTFKNMQCRSVEKQEEPYPRLAEVAADQAEFKRETVAGTLVGFYTPELFGTVSVAGFHLHFLSDDRDFGGHVLDFSLAEGTAAWQSIETLEQHFPIQNKTFMKADIDNENLAEEIEKSE